MGGLGSEGAEFKDHDRFVPITYKKDWSVIRKIDAANGVKYTCKELPFRIKAGRREEAGKCCGSGV